MGSSSWIQGNGGGFVCGYLNLNKINMQMNMDDLNFLTNSYDSTGGGSLPSSSAISASFSCSPETSSTAAHVLMTPATELQFSEVSSSMATFHETPAAMARGTTSAFRRYDRQLAPKRRLTTPACGQRMLKTAISFLAKMHTATRYSHQQQQASAVEPLGHQQQHLISERRRRQKLNDSFHALKTVLPLGSKSKKSGQALILIAAREYVNSLESKVCELEEKNEVLQSELARHATSPEKDGTGEKVDIQITIATASEDRQTGEVCLVKILTPARGNTTDMVLRILQRLKDLMGENVSLVLMNTGEDGDGPRRASLTLQLKKSATHASGSPAYWRSPASSLASVAIGELRVPRAVISEIWPEKGDRRIPASSLVSAASSPVLDCSLPECFRRRRSCPRVPPPRPLPAPPVIMHPTSRSPSPAPMPTDYLKPERSLAPTLMSGGSLHPSAGSRLPPAMGATAELA